jgi:DNA-binding NarL/FixJ family response regulator
MLVSLAIVGNDPAVSKTVKSFEKKNPGMICSGQYAGIDEAIRGIERTNAQVALVDIHVLGTGAPDCIRALASASPDTKLLMLTLKEDHDATFQSLEAGASGYLLKPLRPAQLLGALEDASTGTTPMSEQIARRVIHAFEKGKPHLAAFKSLSPREMEILTDLAGGLLYKEIADKLGLGYGTVHTHIERIYRKLHVHSRAQAAAKLLGA